MSPSPGLDKEDSERDGSSWALEEVTVQWGREMRGPGMTQLNNYTQQELGTGWALTLDSRRPSQRR